MRISFRLGAAALVIATACKEKPPPPEPKPTTASSAAAHDAAPEAAAVAPSIPKNANVVLISIDCLRADMPWTGYPRDIAPNLTKLAKSAVVYTHAYSLSSYTSMSLGAFLGGKYSSEMKRDGYFFSSYGKDNLMFPEVLQSAGIHTMAAHAHGYFGDSGFNQGFDAYEIVPNLKWNNTTDENVTSQDLEPIAERLLSDAKNDTGRFFAWFHFLDPHDMYVKHEGIDWGKTTRDVYDGEVTYTDKWIGKLLDFIAAKPWAQRTVIIVTADHGEAFGEHGLFRHGFELWEPLIRVPLFFVIPGVAPRTIDVPRSAIDMAPTILDLLSLEREASFEGKSLVPELLAQNDAGLEERDIVVDLPKTSDNDKRRALIHGQKKVIAFGAQEYPQVFDLDADPEEKKPITSGEVFTDMSARLRAFGKTLKEVPTTGCKEGCLFGTSKDGGT
jgi:choline-sulfatase